MANRNLPDMAKKAAHDPVWWLWVGLALFFSSMLLASSQNFYSWEESWLKAIYNLPGFFTPAFQVVTLLGSVWGVLATLLFLKWRKKPKLALTEVVAVAAAYLLSLVFKILISRPRPAEVIEGIAAREVFSGLSFGFPSAHAAISTVLALTVLPALPGKWKWLVPLWIVLVALSRLHLGVHVPLDVIGGFGLGLAVTGFVQIASKMPKISPNFFK